MRSDFTAHLAPDLAEVHDATQSRRAELAWRMSYEVPRGHPERPALRAEAEQLDGVLETLRNPEATPGEIAWARNSGVQAAPEADWLPAAQQRLTAHLSPDLADLHDRLQSRRAELAWQMLYEVPRDAPERAVVRAEEAGLDDDLATLRNPEATQSELDWVRNWGGSPDPEAVTDSAPARDTWTATPAAEAEADAADLEMEAAI